MRTILQTFEGGIRLVDDNDGAELAELRRLVLDLATELRVHSGLSLTPSQIAVLVLLDKHEALRIGQVARQQRVAKSSVTRVVAKLESLGFLTRQDDPDDGRSSLVRLTRRGAAALHEGTARQDAFMAGEVAALTGVEQRTLRDAIPVLRRLLDSEQS